MSSLTGTETFQTGDRSGGKHGIKGARERLWSGEYGGGFLNRQILPEELMQSIMAGATGQAVSPAELLARAGIEQNARQAYGMAAGAQGFSPGAAFGQAQQANSQAALSMLPQYAALNADWQQQQQSLFGQLSLAQQSQNDAAAQAREQLLQNYINTLYQGKMNQGPGIGAKIAGGLLTAGGTALGAVLGGPAGAVAGGVAGSGMGNAFLG
jgi:hypothetical protein